MGVSNVTLKYQYASAQLSMEETMAITGKTHREPNKRKLKYEI